MASVNFYLKGAISEKHIEELRNSGDTESLNELLTDPLQIFLKLSTQGRRIQVYTKRRITQKFWDSSKQEYNPRRYRDNCVAKNAWLRELKTEVAELADNNERNGKITTSKEIKEILTNKILNKPIKETFEELLYSFLKDLKKSDGNPVKESTKKKYITAYKHLKDYSKSHNIRLEIERIDDVFLQDFREYLTRIKELSDNTIVKILKEIKTFLRYCMKKGIIKNIDLSDVKTIYKEGEIYVLPIDKVLELQYADLKTERLQRVRDVFCFMCWTGQRYSDINKISHNDISENANGEKVWNLITYKTQTRISVPIIPYAEEILDKYKDFVTPIPIISNQNLNNYLKELGRLVKFGWQVKTSRYYEGVIQQEDVPFYEVLTTHVGRKSYITNSLILGVPERVVKEVSGHKDENSFRRYVQLAESYKSQVIRKAFSKENIRKILEL
jgi:site-specific recombinase XerD